MAGPYRLVGIRRTGSPCTGSIVGHFGQKGYGIEVIPMKPDYAEEASLIVDILTAEGKIITQQVTFEMRGTPDTFFIDVLAGFKEPEEEEAEEADV